MKELETLNYTLFGRVNHPIAEVNPLASQALSPDEIKEINSKLIELRLIQIRLESLFATASLRYERGF